ncbi:hypothetical protein BSKO_09990 [Bryopsis sp. KO-2023]|nr:hypothetical protein BSKO_09990 [Bryopsis sp. KO-2023]
MADESGYAEVLSDNEFVGEEDQEQQELQQDDDAPDGVIFGEDGAMHPDHPLLQRVQEALKAQLLKAKTSLQEDISEKTKALKDAQTKREAIGVELYGFQQQLANLQIELEKTHENFSKISTERLNIEEELANLKSALQDEESVTKLKRGEADQIQGEVDALATTLKQVELFNEAMKSEIAVTRRATYAAEESMQKLEKQKQEQDFLIDQLQETLKRQNRQLQIITAQHEAQKRETRAAQETLAEAEGEMEGIYYEKQQLVAQWRSSLLAIQRRDEALREIENSLMAQNEQAQAVDTEISTFKRDIVKEQVKNEQLTAVMQKVEGDMKHLTQRIAELKERQDYLQETYGKLQKSLEQTEDRMQRSDMEAKAIDTETDSVRRIYVKIASDTQDLKEQMISALGEQATAERSSSKTAKETQKLRQMVRKEEMLAIDLQNELAKLQVDILNTQSHNDRLQATMKLLNEELADKEKVVGQYETDVRHKNDDVEKRTRELDRLNRRYEKLTADLEDESTGPLEATINNLQREIQRKGVEAQELQRRWIGFQMELVTLQNENNKLSESISTLNCKHTVIFQKRRRLEQQLEHHNREIKTLDNGMFHLHTDIQRLNTLIAKNSELQAVLENDNFNLENDIVADLKNTEEEAVRLECQIEQAGDEKRGVVSDILEVEREIMLWERKIQLEHEMQNVLDPEVGQDVTSAMKKEIHRMELRHAELLRIQEKLMQEMERSISKRDVIATKGKAVAARKGPDMTEQQLKKACSELKRSIRDTGKEAQATDQRIGELDEERAKIAEAMEEAGNGIKELREKEDGLRQHLDELVSGKTIALLETAQFQKASRRLEDIQLGRYRQCVQNPASLTEEMEKALEKLEKLNNVMNEVSESNPEIKPTVDKILSHAVRVL